MITVATIYYESTLVPPWSRCYTPIWVDRLYRGVARHYKQPFRFVCLVDKDDYDFEERVEMQPLKHTKWSTACLQMFAIKADRLVLFGLDTVIVGALDEIFNYDGPLAVPRDPYRPRNPCNGVVLCPTRQDIADSNAPSDMAALESFGHDWLDDLFPSQILSYKVHMRDSGHEAPPPGARIVYFHGEPKQHTLLLGPQHDWIAECWK